MQWLVENVYHGPGALGVQRGWKDGAAEDGPMFSRAPRLISCAPLNILLYAQVLVECGWKDGAEAEDDGVFLMEISDVAKYDRPVLV
jgi:hypothetical protein